MTATEAPTDVLERTRALSGLIQAEAEASERLGTMTRPVIDALAAAGLFWILVPRELGGLEADIATSLEVFEEVARADGSTGWSLMANATSSCFAAIYTSDDAARTMFADGRRGIHAGMLGPVGQARADDGGYVVSGRYQFGSGCGHASWFGAGVMELGDDGPAVTDSGLPAMRVVFVPRDRVELLGNWDVMGLGGTGSFDYLIDRERVEAGFSFPLLEATQRRGVPTLRIGLFGLTAAGHAGFALGVGKRALEEILIIAKHKQRLGAESVADQQLFQHDFAMQDAAMRAARAYTYQAFDEAETAAVTDGVPTLEQAQRMRQATTYATRVAADVTRFAYTWAGSIGLRNPSVVQRCFRDMHAGTQHIYVDNNTLTAYTQAMLAGA